MANGRAGVTVANYSAAMLEYLADDNMEHARNASNDYKVKCVIQ